MIQKRVVMKTIKKIKAWDVLVRFTHWAAAIVMSQLQRQNLIKAMITGNKTVSVYEQDNTQSDLIKEDAIVKEDGIV